MRPSVSVLVVSPPACFDLVPSRSGSGTSVAGLATVETVNANHHLSTEEAVMLVDAGCALGPGRGSGHSGGTAASSVSNPVPTVL